jgi:glycosyltransferase involved in cell wall biosynthesis
VTAKPIENAVSGARRIVFLLSHSTSGGAQEIWANLAEGLRARGHQVMLAALYPGDTPAQELAPPTTWTYAVSERPASLGAKLAMVRDLARLFDRFEADMVFTALPAANVLAPIAATLARRRVRVVISHHSPSDTYNPALNLVDGLTGSLASVAHIVGVSDAVRRTHQGKPATYRRKLKTIKNTLPPDVEARIARLAEARQGRRTGRQVVAIGRLAEQKNYPVLLRAAVHMPDVVVRIVGDGSEGLALKALAAELGVAGRVQFLGFHPRAETLEILAGGDVFVQPSLFEGHSLALIEAAKLGMPLVVSDAQVQIEGVTAPDGALCGAVVGVQDDRSLAREILRLLDDPAHYAVAAAQATALGAAATYDAMITSYEQLMACTDRNLSRDKRA